MVTIKSIDDFIKFKEFTTSPICYVYYKESLTNAYYVGFTTQQGYYYLRNHHKMKKIKDVINNGFSVQIYTKYNEDSLIKLFKPKLNIQKGTGICGRNIKKEQIISVGDIISMVKNNSIYENKTLFYKNTVYRKIYKNIYPTYYSVWDNLFKNKNEFVSIDSKIVKYVIEKEKLKEENKIFNQNYNQIINNELFINTFNKYDKTNNLFNSICSILKFCKIPMLYASYILIHEVYLNNFKILLEENNINKETLETNRNEWYYLFDSMNNYIKIHNELIHILNFNNYLIDINIINIKKVMRELCYSYRIAIKEHFNEIYLLSIR
jgi:hypothetical protein